MLHRSVKQDNFSYKKPVYCSELILNDLYKASYYLKVTNLACCSTLTLLSNVHEVLVQTPTAPIRHLNYLIILIGDPGVVTSFN